METGCLLTISCQEYVFQVTVADTKEVRNNAVSSCKGGGGNQMKDADTKILLRQYYMTLFRRFQRFTIARAVPTAGMLFAVLKQNRSDHLLFERKPSRNSSQ